MQTIVIGSLNTDIVALGVEHFPKPGEHVYGSELLISPGGKSRNIAEMMAHLQPAGDVAMVGRTTKDRYGLWQVPIRALVAAGVNTDYINTLDCADTGKLPGVALIPVDQAGNNQIFVLPGISDDFSPDDIDRAVELFIQAGKNNGALVITLECPLPTAIHAVKLANAKGMKVFFDPGGIRSKSQVAELLRQSIYLIKPNEHEAKILTGIDVTDLVTAEKAATALQKQGIENVLITVGEAGAYLFTKHTRKHIPIPEIIIDSDAKDETGSGDQTMAVITTFLLQGVTVEKAARLAVLAGTLQFHKLGVQPVTMDELQRYI